MILEILLLVVGFFILIKGADIFVDGASSIATKFKVPKILIGLTIVAFGTSFPELAVSIKSVISNNHDIVLGNVIGSNIMNILLILGVSSFFHALKVENNTIKKEIPFMILISILFSALISDSIFDKGVVNAFTRSDGIIILLFFIIFIYYLISMALKKKDEGGEETKAMPLWKGFLYVLVGLVMIFFGSNFVVDNASSIAKGMGVSEKMISLTIIALGTSLPELVTSVTAAKKGECDLAVGNVIGSNIFNIGVVLGIPISLFGGINKINFSYLDMSVMLISASLLFFFSLNDHKISKREGLIFIVIFIIYYGYVIING